MMVLFYSLSLSISYCTHTSVSFLHQTEPPAEDGDIDAISDLVQEDGGVDYAERISLIKHLNISSTHEKVVQTL